MSAKEMKNRRPERKPVKGKVEEVVFTIKESLFPFSTFRLQAITIVLVGFIFYFNSLFNQYALDDDIVIVKNDYVLKGFGGIPKILSTDAYDSFYKQMGVTQALSGGRYRPLSIVTFAIEQQFFGANPFVRHFMSVVFFLLSMVLLLYFLRQVVFKEYPDIAFLAVLLFAIHPIHSEVIANAKSRDEILSLLFIVLTWIFAFRYQESKKIKDSLISLLCFFLALLSKEWGITLVIIMPVMFYIFKKYDFKRSIVNGLPYLGIAIIYFMIRFSIVGFKSLPTDEVLNNPYYFATASQKLATKIFVLGKYLGLLIFPHPLSADYSYNQIPYLNFTSAAVWISLLIHLSLIVLFFVYLKRRHVFAFAILFYLANLFLVSNLLMDIGATMGERLIYHSSLGFVIVIAYLSMHGIEKLKSSLLVKKAVLFSLLGVVMVLFGFKNYERNAAWENDITLFINDVNTVPNSALANGNAGARYIDLADMPENKAHSKEMLNKALGYLNKAKTIHPKYVNAYLNLGLAYYLLDDYEQAKQNWDQAKQYFPSNPILRNFYVILGQAYLNRGLNQGKKGDLKSAIISIQKASEVDPSNPQILYNLGGANYTLGNYPAARAAWEKTLQLKPDYTDAKKGLEAMGNR